jgi:hypothetical protein
MKKFLFSLTMVVALVGVCMMTSCKDDDEPVDPIEQHDGGQIN